MPRLVAPEGASGITNLIITKPWEGPVTEKIEVIVEPNSTAQVHISKSQDGNQNERKGDAPKDDANALLALVQDLASFPSNPSKDIYGLNLKLEYSQQGKQWKSDEPGSSVETVEAEQKQAFKDIVEQIESFARQFAKDAAI